MMTKINTIAIALTDKMYCAFIAILFLRAKRFEPSYACGKKYLKNEEDSYPFPQSERLGYQAICA